jgi:hypothetical protein
MITILLTIHILNWIGYFILLFILWWIIDKLSGGEITNEIGGLVLMMITTVYTLLYIMYFSSHTWMDVIHWIAKNVTL